jgi:hypothetical protein
MRLPVFVQAFLDGLTLAVLFGKVERPGAPEHLFTQEGEGRQRRTGGMRLQRCSHFSQSLTVSVFFYSMT